MNPLLAAWNCTPRFTVLVSTASTAPEGAAFCQMLHGHWATAPVVKLQENGLLIEVGRPHVSTPVTPASLMLSAASLVGVNVATVSAAMTLTVPATRLLPAWLTI